MSSNNFKLPFLIMTALFFMLGLITVLVDSLIPRLKDIFELSYFQAGLVQFAFFIAYGLISIPSGALLHKVGYKAGVIWGLVTMGVGCLLFYPAASFRMFPIFILAYFTLAAGMTILQVAINPYVTVLGPREGAASRLNLAQAFNSLGTAIAPALGAVFILSDRISNAAELNGMSVEDQANYYTNEATAVQSPFLILASTLFVLALLVLIAHLPKILGSDSRGSYKEVLKNKKLAMGAAGIFVYVGSEVTIGSYLVNYFLSLDLSNLIISSPLLSAMVELVHKKGTDLIDPKGIIATFVVLYWSGAMVGRFIGAYLSRKIKPNLLLSIFAIGAIMMIIISTLTSGLVAMYSILLVGLFNSIMFPTIFSIAIEDLGELKAEGSGILCTAIAGGAFLPPLYGFLVDVSSFQWAFILLLICYAYIAFYGKRSIKLKT